MTVEELIQFLNDYPRHTRVTFTFVKKERKIFRSPCVGMRLCNEEKYGEEFLELIHCEGEEIADEVRKAFIDKADILH